MTITEFILARVAEWHAEAEDALRERECTAFVRPEIATEPDYSLQSWPDSGVPAVLVGPELVLRQCEAMRTIVDLYGPIQFGESYDGSMVPLGGDGPETYWDAVCALASIWADHPDYQTEWAE